MGKAYSQELRLRALAAYDSGMSKMQVCRTYQFARSTLDAWLHLREQTGHVMPQISYRRGPAPVLQDTPEVHQFMQGHCHSTLSELALAWEQETGQRLSTMTFCSSLRRLGYTRKKRATFTQSAQPSSGNPSYSNWR